MKAGTRPNRDQMHREEQAEVGHNSLIGLAVGVAAIAVIIGAYFLLR